jgi:allantoin racemase
MLDITDSAATLACQLGYRCAIVTTLERPIPQIEESLRNADLHERCASILANGPAVFEPERDELATRTRLTAESRVAVDRAKAIDWLPGRVSIGSESGPRT